ncbi:ATP-binding protein [Ralstonia solanacearum]|uniref:ATP-binding protein n=1 Tax=Ralstonia solanacearum TaxID=305 RepID=UPI000447549F|nr:ATP-binding protein [Ralstonia solanacearum]EUJ16197.1 chemotaxis protein CheY [Ralstonia solanacearum P673]MCL9846162.1 ATP-binding protein [Ralstonia solanacearum]MCL9851253.1 ATP-binding protein [Ralstonia solanacearum]MCL9854370.1 ATP-binding protein [Ralstonia solanacearum]MCL9860350.1 ATP-binding protein [Ralstonia solanacearum]
MMLRRALAAPVHLGRRAGTALLLCATAIALLTASDYTQADDATRALRQMGPPPAPSAAAPMARCAPAAAIVLWTLTVLSIRHMQLRRETRQRRHTEATLARQLDFQHMLMESLPFPLAAQDTQHRYVAVNAAFCHLLGRSREAVLGRTPAHLGLGCARTTARVQDIDRRAVATGQEAREALTITAADGRERRVLYWVAPLRLPDGQPGGTVASLIDLSNLSEIREAQARAKQQAQRLHDSIESLPALVCQFEMRPGTARGRIRYMAGSARETLGAQTDAAPFLLPSPARLVHQDDRRRLHDAALQSATQLTPLDQPFRHVGGDGSVRWLHAHALPRREPDGRTVWTGYLRDVTQERARADALEAARQAAESALHAKDRFLATMSHEIRTPMNGVLGLVELLLQTPLEREQQRMVTLAQESSRALLHILDDILDYAKIEAGHLAVTPAPTDLRELFDSTVGLLAGRAHERSLSVRVEVDAAVPAMVSVDGMRLRQVLSNLLSNAIKFTERGSVHLSAACVGAATDTAHLIIRITDTGIGIAPEAQATLFTPFVQADSPASRRHGGTGLGLAISRQLARLMGGSLDMDSTPGVGTTLTLRLAAPVISARYRLPHLAGATVRVDVDDAACRRALEQFAAAAGLRVVRDGTAALTLMDSARVPADVPRVVPVTGEAPYAGTGRNPQEPDTLSTNPLSWQAFMQACDAVFAQLPGDSATTRMPVSSSAPPPTSTTETLGAHILVAEDHPINRELLAKQLRLLGYRVTLAEDGAAALQRLSETRFDALLTDCCMPRLNGFELARRIRQRERQTPGRPRLAILAITATTLAEEHARCRAVGMDDCVLKPTTLAALQEALSRLWHIEVRPDPPEAPAVAPRNALAFRLDDLRRTLGDGPATISLIRVFAATLEDDAKQLRALLAAADRPALRKWTHRTGGALALLQHAAINAEMSAFRHAVQGADDGDSADFQDAGSRMTQLLAHLQDVMRLAETTPLGTAPTRP